MSKKCRPHLEKQCCQRSHLVRHKKGQNTVIQRANRFIKKRRKEARRCHTHPMETWKMPGLGRHHARYVCSVTPDHNILAAWINRKFVSNVQDSEVCQHSPDAHLHTDRHRNNWSNEPPGKRAYHRNWQANHESHRWSEGVHLPLPTSVRGNTTRKHALLHRVFRHREYIMF